MEIWNILLNKDFINYKKPIMLVRKFLFVVLGLTMYICVSFAYNKISQPLFSFVDSSTEESPEEENDDDRNTIQVALLLDTSGSMSGLIEQAKSQLWNILNELARTEKDNEESKLEIALYEYGNPRKTKDVNQIHQLTAFTTDMDLVSEKLFALNTSGGEEYCGAMIKTSLSDLDWKSDNGLRIIYIAGNEGFTQGPVSYETACKEAREKGVVINTVFCGDYNQGIQENWKAGALSGAGEYLNIDHNAETVYVPTPFDDKIENLNKELNRTYIPYGKKGKEKRMNQAIQDSNASTYSKSNAVDRAAFKSSKKYKATDWDLVDAYKKDKGVLKNVEIHTDTLKNLTPEALEAEIEAISVRRANIQNEIQKLDKERRVYKANQVKDEKETSLQKAMISTIQKQAKEKGYKIKE